MNLDPKKGDAAGIASLMALEALYEAKRIEAVKALEQLAAAKRHAFVQLHKVQLLFKYLNWKQRDLINDCHAGARSLNTLYTFPAASSAYAARRPGSYTRDILKAMEMPSAKGRRIKVLRHNILQLGTIQLRAAELTGILAQSAAVFNRHYTTSCRELFPLGCLSRLWRSTRRFFSRPYFSPNDMRCLKSLRQAAGFVLEMTDASVLNSRTA